MNGAAMAGAYGKRLGESVGLNSAPAVKTQLLQTAEFATTHLSWDEPECEKATRIGMEDAFLVFHQRRAIPANPWWVDGRAIAMKPVSRGQSLLLNLNEEHRSVVRSAVDTLAFYVPRLSLDRIADEQGIRRPIILRSTYGDPVDDTVIGHLGECLLPAVHRPEQANRLFTDCVSLAMVAHLATNYGDCPAWAAPRRGGLAAWQERRAKELLMAHLDGDILLEELARECRLSRSHFIRAFKTTTGIPPHQWLLARRVELAQDLLRNPILPLETIAIRCGFADQSHFTRVFSKLTGISPGEWRRSRS
jgi:AraC-like DNA-binding protein